MARNQEPPGASNWLQLLSKHNMMLHYLVFKENKGNRRHTVTWPSNQRHNRGDIDDPASVPGMMRFLGEHLSNGVFATKED